jgi:N-terminal domain of galactosyltransferase
MLQTSFTIQRSLILQVSINFNSDRKVSESFDFFKDPYIGGILIVPNQIYELTNGLRDDFWGWGGEDEE